MSDNMITREDGFGAAVEFYQRMADDLRLQLAERDATIIAFQTRVTELRHDLNMVIDQRNAANARIAELEAAQAWVSVDERLPEVAEWCLVYGKQLHATPHIVNRSVTSMRLLSGSSETVSWWIRESKLTSPQTRPLVTHWMPLPPPPVTDVTP